MSRTTPVLLYDGDCAICREWVNYWLSLTAERVIYRSYQSALDDYPQLDAADCRRSIQLIESDGTIYSGAAATLKLLSRLPGRGLGWWLYRYVPGFALVAELTYRLSARQRGLLRSLTHVLWGAHYSAPRHEWVQWWFLRGLGLIYVFAFISAGTQVPGLIGTEGLLPIADFLDRLHGYYDNVWYYAPTLFWLGHSDLLLQLLCLAGAISGALVLCNRLTTPALIAAFVFYLSLVHPGQDFFQFQWDLLLLETGFLAIFIDSWPNLTRWLYRWLLFRYLFMAGIAKLTSGDTSWQDLTALQYHFETQPLPTPFAWYAHQLPDALLTVMTAATLVLEVVLVFLVFTPRRPRMLLAWLLLTFQIAILLTGNYNFFNLLTMLLTVWLFDDAAITRLTGQARGWLATCRPVRPLPCVFGMALAVMIVLPGLNQISLRCCQQVLPVARQIDKALAPLLIVNRYGLFANMTKRRPEIQIQGSMNGEDWIAYDFRYKPGDPAQAPGWNIPHQPRLDWQMWFAALSRADRQRWFEPLLIGLLENEPMITTLLADNPFPENGPRYIRAMIYQYHFTDYTERARSGHWWRRERQDIYYPSMSLEQMQNRSRGGLPFQR